MCGEEPSRCVVLSSELNSGINWIDAAPGLASVLGQKKYTIKKIFIQYIVNLSDLLPVIIKPLYDSLKN
jgi:hypothetical protein